MTSFYRREFWNVGVGQSCKQSASAKQGEAIQIWNPCPCFRDSPVCTLFPRLAARRTSPRLFQEAAPSGELRKQSANGRASKIRALVFHKILTGLYSLNTYYKLFGAKGLKGFLLSYTSLFSDFGISTGLQIDVYSPLLTRPPESNSENKSVIRLVFVPKWRIRCHFWHVGPLTSLGTWWTGREIRIWDFQNGISSLTIFRQNTLDNLRLVVWCYMVQIFSPVQFILMLVFFPPVKISVKNPNTQQEYILIMFLFCLLYRRGLLLIMSCIGPLPMRDL
jgi:hypothetical protein